MSGDGVFSVTILNEGNVLCHSDCKRANGATHILFTTMACDQVYNIAGGASRELLDGVLFVGDRRCKRHSLTSYPRIVLTHRTFCTSRSLPSHERKAGV